MLQLVKHKQYRKPTGFRDGGGVEVDVLVVVVPESGGGVEDGGVADPVSLELEGGGRPADTVHALTTRMRFSPFDPVTGVNVRVHVSVTGPASLRSYVREFSKDGHATHV